MKKVKIFESDKQKVNESYVSDQINKVIEPETEYGYSIKISNSGQPNTETNYLKITKNKLLEIQAILEKQ